MTRIILWFSIVMLMISCKQDIKQENHINKIAKEKTTVAQSIAKANGFDNWQKINTINFTFNVDRGSNHFERSWSWNPKTHRVSLMTAKDTIHYNHKAIDSLSINADKSFINDKFWLLVPFQLLWDDGTTISKPTKAIAPISNTEMNTISLVYGNEGGYTPGDAYDLYYGEDFIIKEWVFRKGNSETPTMSTTFENYEVFQGIKIAKTHKTADGKFKLYFSNISIE